MSKKMMKRSLALGALMAFVITGSAYAETFIGGKWTEDWHKAETFEINLTEDSVLQGGIQDANDGHIIDGKPVRDTWILNLNNKTLESTGSIMIDGGILDINGDAGSVLNLNGTLGLSGTVDIDTLNIKNGSLCTYGSTMKVTTQSIVINYNDPVLGIGINANGAAGGITINTKDLTVNGVAGAITSAYSNTVNITTDKLNIANGGTDGILACLDSSIVLNANQGNINSDVYAGVIYGGKGVVDLTLGSGVTLTGRVVTDTTVTGEGASSSTLTLNGATWNVTGESNVSVIGGSDANIKVEDAKEAAGWVKVGEMKAKKLTVATVTEGSDTDATLKALSEVVVRDDEEGTLAATHVQLQNAVYDKLVVEANDLGNVVEKAIAQANINVSDMAALGLMSWRAETNDMNKRMGELRNANGEHGVWVRAVGGEDEYKSVEYDYTQYQLGYDEKLSTDPSWTVGVALSYTDGESKFAKGSGENENKGVAIYGSKLNADGSFIDLIAKYSRMENDFKTIGGMGDADYSTNGYSFSAEYGKRIQQGNGLWIEPQVELTYGRVADVDYVTASGMKVAQDSMESIVGRVGFSLGKDIKQGNVYARASYLYDFDGETSVSLGGQENLEQDLGGGWWEVGVGANINLSKATYIYADVEKTFGGEVDTNWQWNLGVRYSF